MFHKIIILLLTISLILLLLVGCKTKKKIYTIGISEFTEDPSTKQAEKGFIQAFIDAGVKPDIDVRFDIANAQGDFPTTTLIAQKFVSEKYKNIANRVFL